MCSSANCPVLLYKMPAPRKCSHFFSKRGRYLSRTPLSSPCPGQAVKNAPFLSHNVFTTKVLIEDNIFFCLLLETCNHLFITGISRIEQVKAATGVRQRLFKSSERTKSEWKLVWSINRALWDSIYFFCCCCTKNHIPIYPNFLSWMDQWRH